MAYYRVHRDSAGAGTITAASSAGDSESEFWDRGQIAAAWVPATLSVFQAESRAPGPDRQGLRPCQGLRPGSQAVCDPDTAACSPARRTLTGGYYRGPWQL